MPGGTAGFRLKRASMNAIFLARNIEPCPRSSRSAEAPMSAFQEVVRLAAEQTTEAAEQFDAGAEVHWLPTPTCSRCFYLLANGRTGREIATELGADERSVRRWMVAAGCTAPD